MLAVCEALPGCGKRRCDWSEAALGVRNYLTQSHLFAFPEAHAAKQVSYPGSCHCEGTAPACVMA